ncbi:FUSC family protein [Swingsia samuiensis]|uniref:FUSC family protein n=1 Tax=Swingsia samuiensis TaxID=1293412 RepID=A0A4Y6UJ59_9PROT|nr:FUSC family protein [Swingsia samuiensis]QDH17104.1 FUSC family protein [Swingsia samuiensis]
MSLSWQAILRPGWVSFTLRTWVAFVLALLIAFWAQVDSPAGAGVTVMILAQPLRGQALSKAFYRMLGTLIGVGVSIVLVALFNQNRRLFLGTTALWLGACAFVGTLERNFRAYAALLAGYVVALVAVATIDAPQNVFQVGIARATTVTIGIAAVAIVNLMSGSPQAWRSLARGLQYSGQRIRQISQAALMGDIIPSNEELTAISTEILSLVTHISYARTELSYGRRRMAGARLSLVGMLTVLTCSRSIAVLLKEGDISDIVIRHVRSWHERVVDGSNRHETMREILSGINEEDPDYIVSPRDAWFLERASTLISNRLHIRTGLNTLLKAAPAGEALKLAKLADNPDYITAFINAMRVILGFSIVAAVCIGTGIPASSIILSQSALVLTLATVTLDLAQFGKGVIIGTPLGILAAAIMSFGVLPWVYTPQTLALVMLPQTIIACLLIMNPKTSAIGFHYGTFFLVFMNLGNPHVYDVGSFITRNVFYLAAAALSFVLLVLVWPPTVRRYRFRLAVGIARDLERQLDGHGEAMGPALLSRKYDRLSQFLLLTRKLDSAGKVTLNVFERFVGLEDLASTIARVRLYLRQASKVAALREYTSPAQKALSQDNLTVVEQDLDQLNQRFLERFQKDIAGEDVFILNCVAGLEAVRVMLLRNKTAIHHYGIGRRRW